MKGRGKHIECESDVLGTLSINELFMLLNNDEDINAVMMERSDSGLALLIDREYADKYKGIIEWILEDVKR